MEESTAVPIDVESSKSLDTVSDQTTEGFSMNTQDGILNPNGSNCSVSNHALQSSSTLVNGSVSSDSVSSPMLTSADTQVPSLNSVKSVALVDPQFQVVKNAMPASGSIYSSITNHYVHPQTYGSGTVLPSVFSPVPPPVVSFPSPGANHAASNAFHGASTLMPDGQLSNPNSSTAGIRGVSNISSTTQTVQVQAMQFHVNSAPGSNAVAVPTLNAHQGQTWPAAPGNLVGQHPMLAAHPYAAPMGHWHQNTPSGVPPRPQFIPYSSNVAAPFPGTLYPSIPFSSSQPPRANLALLSNQPFISPSAHVLEIRNNSGMMSDLPPGTGSVKNASDVKGTTADTEQSASWTSHRTESGVIYYYNALTGESTYEKPIGFKEVTTAKAQPAPTAWEKVTGTDWVSVTTNDGKKYYYNSKTKISSWQVPADVLEVMRKQDAELPKEQSTMVKSDTSTDKESGFTRLDTPAINLENHDLASSKSVISPASSSALDSIKKKLQDSATLENTSLIPTPVLDSLKLNGSNGGESTEQNESNKEKPKDTNADNNLPDSSSDSEDLDSGPSKEQCILQFKEMLKERGVAPFSKWEKELPKIVFDSRFKAISSHSLRRSLFDHYVKTRAEEERKEKRAAQKAAIDGFKQLLQEASEDIDQNTNYNSFKRKWGDDTRFKALNRKDIEVLLNERVLPLRKVAEEKTLALRAETTKMFKSMLKEKIDINTITRWSKVKDSLRSDPRYNSVKHEDREILFNEYISELKASAEEEEQEAKRRRREQEKLRERERELRKRKERDEEEIERMRLKVRRKEAVSSYLALLVEVIKDPQASWTESRPKLEKDPQGRATNPELQATELEKLFREHVNMLLDRCANDFKELLSEALSGEVAGKESEDGKTVLNSWSTAKDLLKNDPRYTKMPRKEREIIWRRYAETTLRKLKEPKDEKEDGKARESHPRSKRRHDNR